MTDPVWLPGKHDWRRQRRCAICGAERAWDDAAAEWAPYIGPCIARIKDPVPGLYTTAEAAVAIGIGYDAFITRVQSRRIHPTCVGQRNNVYYWREEQLAEIAETNAEWDKRRDRPRA